MKKIYTIIISLLFVTILFTGCTKDEQLNRSPNVVSVDLNTINNFTPDISVIPDLYNSFRNALDAQHNSDFTLKDEIIAEDRPLDETLWLLETSLNTNYGFRKDSLTDFTTNFFEFTVNNKSINANGMPVIDGQDLVNLYYAMVDTVENSCQENEYFRFGIVESGFYWTGVLPPGVDPTPFPNGTSMNAYNAAIAYNNKINNHSGLIPWEHDPNYIFSMSSNGYDGFDYPEYLWHKGAYSDCNVILYTNELNQYLFSTKTFIDLFNDINDPDSWLAQVDIYCFFDSYHIKACHSVQIFILYRIYIGNN